jgi:CDP-diacylglycerol---serine O-phosphatidyltransferase
MSDFENTGDLKLIGGPTSKMKKKVSMHIYVLPNMLTTANLFFGFYSIIMSIKGDFIYASYAVVAAAIFDLFDGRLARMTRTTSKFGAEYDSLSDLVSFGMAPGILLYLWALQPFGRVGWVASFLYVACGALRLARFNVQVGVIEKQYFQGLPIPMAAGIVASSVLAFRELGLESYNSVYLLGMTFLLSMVMVSTFRYRSFKDMDLKHRMPFSYLVLGILLFVVVAYNPEVMLFVLFLTYAVLGAVFGLFRLGKLPKKLKSAPEYLEQSHGDLLEEEDDE